MIWWREAGHFADCVECAGCVDLTGSSARPWPGLPVLPFYVSSQLNLRQLLSIGRHCGGLSDVGWAFLFVSLAALGARQRMRPQSVIFSALLLGGVLCGDRCRADDLARIVPAATAGELPVLIPQSSADSGQVSAANAAVQSAGYVERGPGLPPVEDTSPAPLKHCSVVGAIRFPATYASEASPFLLRNLIEQAGGLTPQATGIVRILHGGKQQNVNLTSSLGAVVIPPESVIVVDSAAAGPHPAEADGQPYVDVACLQLCERPVVMWLKPAEATVPRLLEHLGQSASIAGSVRVLAPLSGRPLPGDALVSGSVVLFDPTAMDQVALAEALRRSPLQDLVPVETPTHRQVAADTVDLYQFLEAGADTTANGSTITAEATTSESLLAPPLQAPLDNRDEPASTAPATLEPATPAETPPTGISGGEIGVHPTSAVQLQSVNGPRVLPHPEAPAARHETLNAEASLDDARQAASMSATSEEVLEAPPVDANTQWMNFGSSIAAWLLCGLAGYGVFRIWIQQHERRRSAESLPRFDTEAVKPTAIRETRPSLNQLIENSLPLREEETPALPQAFHGRTVGFRYLIRSGPHPLQGPHFATARPSQPVADASAAITSGPTRSTHHSDRGTHRFDAAEIPGPPATATPVAQRRTARGVSAVERALRTVLREGRDGAP